MNKSVMSHNLKLTVIHDEKKHDVPDDAQFQQWANSISDFNDAAGTVAIKVVGSDEMQSLNKQFRGKDKPTNVLSFPFESFDDIAMETAILGDIALCADVIETEAKAQHKTLEAHYAHMTIHGILHLLGYDHIEDNEAKRMEALEISCLEKLGYTDPYE
jgi:probable rRNA maturation factor